MPIIDPRTDKKIVRIFDPRTGKDVKKVLARNAGGSWSTVYEHEHNTMYTYLKYVTTSEKANCVFPLTGIEMIDASYRIDIKIGAFVLEDKSNVAVRLRNKNNSAAVVSIRYSIGIVSRGSSGIGYDEMVFPSSAVPWEYVITNETLSRNGLAFSSGNITATSALVYVYPLSDIMFGIKYDGNPNLGTCTYYDVKIRPNAAAPVYQIRPVRRNSDGMLGMYCPQWDRFQPFSGGVVIAGEDL